MYLPHSPVKPTNSTRDPIPISPSQGQAQASVQVHASVQGQAASQGLASYQGHHSAQDQTQASAQGHHSPRGLMFLPFNYFSLPSSSNFTM